MNSTQEKVYKRQWRELEDGTKQKISQSLSGKPKSYSHRSAIAQGMKEYWSNVKNKPQPKATIQDIMM